MGQRPRPPSSTEMPILSLSMLNWWYPKKAFIQEEQPQAPEPASMECGWFPSHQRTEKQWMSQLLTGFQEQENSLKIGMLLRLGLKNRRTQRIQENNSDVFVSSTETFPMFFGTRIRASAMIIKTTWTFRMAYWAPLWSVCNSSCRSYHHVEFGHRVT